MRAIHVGDDWCTLVDYHQETILTDVRAFIAIQLSSEMLGLLSEQIDQIKDCIPRDAIRWVRVNNIHLTLKFLGDIASNDLQRVSRSMQSVAARHEPFQFAVASFGCFPNMNKPRALWIGIQEPSGALMNMYTDLEETLNAAGFARERRAFHPHLTIGRVKRTIRGDAGIALSASLKDVKLGSIGSMVVDAIVLMRSELRPTGAVYTQLSSASMKEEG